MIMDRRWQLVLDGLECEKAPFGKGTLVRFRAALMTQGGDRLLINQTVELAKTIGGYSSRSLRAALDSSPLWGAARVEDTYNLLGHALRKALSLIARQQGMDLSEIASIAGGEILTTSSLKAAKRPKLGRKGCSHSSTSHDSGDSQSGRNLGSSTNAY